MLEVFVEVSEHVSEGRVQGRHIYVFVVLLSVGCASSLPSVSLCTHPYGRPFNNSEVKTHKTLTLTIFFSRKFGTY